MVKAAEDGNAFVTLQVGDIDEILCEHHERVVGKDNCVHFEGHILQIPRQIYRFNFVKVKVMVHCYLDGHLALFHGPRKLAEYGCDGQLIDTKEKHEEVEKACTAH